MDVLRDTGLLKLGFNLIVADDCWIAENRSSSGEIVADPTRFPSGMNMLTDYAHKLGMKFG
jgi:alpha-galactosidase